MLIPIYLLLFVTLTLARAVISNTDFDIYYGVPFRIRWEDAEGPVTLGVSIIRKDDVLPYTILLANNSVLASQIWTPDRQDYPPDFDYAFAITDDDGVKHTATWQIKDLSETSTQTTSTSPVSDLQTESVTSFTSSTKTSSTKTTSTTTTTTRDSFEGFSTSQRNSERNGLTTASSVGIAVGGIIMLFVIVLLVYKLGKSSRKTRQIVAENERNKKGEWNKPELGGEGVLVQQPTPVQPQAPQELDAGYGYHEMGTQPQDGQPGPSREREQIPELDAPVEKRGRLRQVKAMASRST